MPPLTSHPQNNPENLPAKAPNASKADANRKSNVQENAKGSAAFNPESKRSSGVSEAENGVGVHTKRELRAAPATMAVTATSARQRKKVQPMLSALERQRLRRLQLLRLARHGASLAAALLLSESHPPHPSISVLTSSTRRSTKDNAAGASAKTKSDGLLSRRATTEIDDEKSTNSSKSCLTPHKETSMAVTSRKQGTGAESAVVATSALRMHEQPSTTGVTSALDFTTPSTSAPLMAAVPCSYAGLWRELLRLQFNQPCTDRDEPDTQNAITADPAKSTHNRKTNVVESDPLDWASKDHTELDRVQHRLPSSLSSLTDQLQALDAHWRTFFLGTSQKHHGGSCRGGATMLQAQTCVSPPYFPFLTSGEQYTMRRYTRTYRNAGAVQTEGIEMTDLDAVPAFSNAPRHLFDSESANCLFFMDYI